MQPSNTKPRTSIQRGRKRAVDDMLTAYDIIDDSLLCHVAQIRNGSPIVTPTCHWRDEDRLYWHGHARAFNVIGSANSEVCINISQLDGLVLARSAFHHSVNYRSVTLFGQPNLVTEKAEKCLQLEKFIERISPGRWRKLRPITQKELMITSVAWIPINEISVKVRADGVGDEESDLNWPVWAGVVPVEKHFDKSILEVQSEFTKPILPSVFQHKIYK